MSVLCTVTPKRNRFVPNILPGRKRIEQEMTLELNKNEIRKCMNEGCLVAIIENGVKVQLDEKNWYKKVEELAPIDPEPPKPEPIDTEYAFIGSAKVGFFRVM